MKRFVSMILGSLLCAGSVATTSCTDKDEPKASLKLSAQSVQLNAAGNLQQITITTNQPTWSASRPEADNWCTLQREGEGLLIVAKPLTEITARTTLATITAGTLSIPITITQAGATPSLTLDKQQVELDITGAAQTVSITTNMGDWTASRPEADEWCTLSTQGNTLSISATLCTVAERTTTVTVEAGGNALTHMVAVSQKGGILSYEITIPTDFSECAVKKAVYNKEQVAEICLEYIRTTGIDKQMTVIYPVVDGKVDLSLGVEIETGGQIVWNTAANTCTYTQGSAQDLTKVWIEDGIVKTATQSKAIVKATVNSDLLLDVRGASSEMYRIVKIGTQYWMADNLRAERYLDGSAISTEWKDNITGAYCYLYNTPGDYKATYGALYNGFATLNAAGFAPEEWEVPSNTAWTKLRTYIGTPYGTKLKANSGWSTGNGSGITGFDALPAQSYNTALGFVDTPVETWFWSTNLIYDFLTRKNSQFYARFTDTSPNMTFNTNTSSGSYHGQEFGHSVRCIRK